MPTVKNILLLLALFLIVHSAFGQLKEDSTKENKYLPTNLFYFQALGDNYLAGFNYERRYFKRKFVGLSIRTGLGLTPNGGTLLIGNNFIIGRRILFGELGINPGVLQENHSSYIFISANIGLRLQRPNGKIFCKLIYNPILYTPHQFGIPFAFCIGKGF